MLSTDSNPEVTEMLLAEAADLDVVDMHGNTALHQVHTAGAKCQEEKGQFKHQHFGRGILCLSTIGFKL
jgi:hypothetical protein